MATREELEEVVEQAVARAERRILNRIRTDAAWVHLTETLREGRPGFSSSRIPAFLPNLVDAYEAALEHIRAKEE